MQTQNEGKPKLVDVKKALQEKNPKLYKFLPSFIINFLKKIIHQDEINQIIIKFHDKQGLEFINSGLQHMDVKTNSKGLENIPKE